jgi:hypothetical protein
METLDLQREALTLRPPGHPNRAISCGNLAISLQTYFDRTGSHILLDEIRSIANESLSTSYPGDRWRPASVLTRLHLQTGTNMFDVHTAIRYLHESLVHHPDNFAEAISEIVLSLDLVWIRADALQLEHHVALAPIYQRLIRLLPYLTNPALGTQAQLRALQHVSQMGSDTFVNAILAGNWSLGLEDMEFAQGLLLSQCLHYRDPQLQDVPSSLAAKLQEHLNMLVSSSATSQDHSTAITTRNPRDIQHNHAVQVYALLREVREVPGLDRFMLGETYATLCTVASTHPVVLIVGARNRAYAILLTSDPYNNALLPLDVNGEEFRDAKSISYATRAYRSAATDHENISERDINRATKLKMMNHSTLKTRQLRYIWVKLVKPVLDRLDVQVSFPCLRCDSTTD